MSEQGDANTPAANAAIAQGQDASAAAGGDGGGGPPGGRFTLGPMVDGSRPDRHVSYQRRPDDPLYRPLRIYTVDPARSALKGATLTVNVPYEPLTPGPVGARFRILGAETRGITRALGSGRAETILRGYVPVDLEDRTVMIRNGCDPAPCDPVLHHQMAYAVACNTYVAFRHALGREIDWAFKNPRLTLDLHKLEQTREARYTGTPLGEIEFGYFTAGDQVCGRVPPMGIVYLCLSHDVIAHEVTHALVDGLRTHFGRRYTGHADVDAFHEAFADLIALLLRFSYADVVREAIEERNGRFWLHESFMKFGIQAAQGGGTEALREAGLFGSAKRYDPATDVYALGTVLVSAVLEALVVVYQRKAEPFIRLASGGSGLFAEGARYPAGLVDLLTRTASRLASHFLSICIRALDYCPPTGVDFGEYLRALITADRELVPDDPWGYREALIDSFIRRRIYPRRVQSMSPDALRWGRPRTAEPIRSEALSFAALKFAGDPASPFSPEEVKRRAEALGRLVTDPARLDEFGLAMTGDPALGGDPVDLPIVQSVRSARRVGPDGQVVFDLVCEVTQCRHVARPGEESLPYWGGSTIIIDPDGVVRYIVSKSVTDRGQIDRKLHYEAIRNAVEEVDPATAT